MRTRIGEFIDNALSAADLLQGFVDLALDQLDKLSPAEQSALEAEFRKRSPADAEEAGAIAIVLRLLQDLREDS